jgi:tRNA-2-methylthio-N6-dimethylallyladenosine synthase
MPAQSGSDRVLHAMRRGYTAAQYRDTVALARELIPDVAVQSDFIVGFPGETKDDFERTAQLLRDLRFQNSFVFKYSPRPGTGAAKMEDDVPLDEKKRRNIALLDIQSRVNRESHDGYIGREAEVLVEGVSKRDARRLTGRLRTNHIVAFEGDAKDLTGKIVRVRITSATALTLAGEPIRPTREAARGRGAKRS